MANSLYIYTIFNINQLDVIYLGISKALIQNFTSSL